MELVFALVIGALTASGVYLLLRARTFPVVVGLTLLSYGVNLFLFASGRLATGQQPILGSSASYADPLPQALSQHTRWTPHVEHAAPRANLPPCSSKNLHTPGYDLIHRRAPI